MDYKKIEGDSEEGNYTDTCSSVAIGCDESSVCSDTLRESYIVMSFTIGKVSCSGCTTNIENKIKTKYESQGLIDVVAALATYKLSVKIHSYAKEDIKPADIEELVHSLGKLCDFEGMHEMNQSESKKSHRKMHKFHNNRHKLTRERCVKTYHLDVSGMTCGCCESSLTQKTKHIEGVVDANFSFKSNSAKIEIDMDQVSIRDIIETISVGKFTASLSKKSKRFDIREAIEKEAMDKWHKLFYSLFLWIPILLLIWVIPNAYPLNAFIEMFAQPNGPSLYVYITAVLSIVMQAYLGYPLYVSAWAALKSWSSNMDTKVVIGTTSSIIYGISLFFIGYGDLDVNNSSFRVNYCTCIAKHAHSFEVASTIVFIIGLGRYLEAKAKLKTVEKLSDLASIKVTKAQLFTPDDKESITLIGECKTIPVELLNKNDLVKVKNGDIIPTDCTVVFGIGYADESMLTGESRLAKKEAGDKVFGGTQFQKGALILRVDVIEEESSLNQILKLVENAQTSKAPIQAYADRISSIFVPIIISLALISWAFWFIAVYTNLFDFGEVRESRFSFAFTFGISTLVIACPCALGLATPTAVMVGSGIAAGLGILIKGGSVLQKASKITAVVFDKTRTLTTGNPEVVDIKTWTTNYTKEELFYFASVCEAESEHPLGRVIANEFMDKLQDKEYEEFNKVSSVLHSVENSFNGEGIVCVMKYTGDSKNLSEDGKFKVYIGNEKLMSRFNIQPSEEVQSELTALEEQGKTVVQMAVKDEVVMLIALEEKHLARSEAREVLQYLKSNNYDIHMITGDQKYAALKVAKALGIKKRNVLYRAYPEDKKHKVQELQQKGHTVVFIGDGVNDSPVLAQSDVGVAINTQSDITVEAADIVIIKDNLYSIIDTLRLTKSTFKRIKINFIWAFIYNVVLIPIAMGALWPCIAFCLSPHLAATAMALSSTSVVLSSLMLKLFRPFNQ